LFFKLTLYECAFGVSCVLTDIQKYFLFNLLSVPVFLSVTDHKAVNSIQSAWKS